MMWIALAGLAFGVLLLLALCVVSARADRAAEREYGVALAVERAIRNEEARQRVN